MLTWNNVGERLYETGISKVVLYPNKSSDDGSSLYNGGVAWNGVTAIEESPSGAEATPLYAGNIKYLNLMSKEEYAATITAYMSPEEFDACDGSVSLTKGVKVRQQPRKEFGFCYRTEVGNDTDGVGHGYVLHLVYGCLASPSSKSHNTINESPEAAELSWEITTTPVSVANAEPTSVVEINSLDVDADKLAALEAILYASTDARLPSPDEVAELLKTA